jgi:hypothetical protein
MYSRLLLLVITLAIALSAQSRDGELTGKITNSSGTGISGVTLTFKEVSGGTTRETTTGSDGSFTINNLPAGNYTVEMTGPGQRKTASAPVRIDASIAPNISLTLEEGSSTETTIVEVEGRAPTLQTESTEVSRAYGTIIVRQLPVIDRQAQELVGLMPGITPPVTTSDRVADPQRRRTFNVNGMPSYANAMHQDGAYQSEPYSNNAVRISPNEAIQALNVRTSNYNAEYGTSGGAWSNTVTRPGQNAVHGSLLYFNTNSFFGTRNPLDNRAVPDSPRYNQHQFGGSLGGPIVKDKVFLFGAYEGFLRRGRNLEIGTVPTAALLNGDFSGFPGIIYNPNSGLPTGASRTPFPNNRIPASQLSPLSAGLLALLPTANLSGSANNLIGSPAMREDNHRGDVKLDHRLSDRSYGFFRYGISQAEILRESLLGTLGNNANASLRNHSGTAGISVNVRPTITGELRVGFARYRNLLTPMGTSPELQTLLDRFSFSGGLPSINIAGLSPIGMLPGYLGKSVSNTFDAATNWGWHTARNRLKFGLGGRTIRASGFDPGSFTTNGSFLFGPGATSLATSSVPGNILANSFAAFLAGVPTQSGVFNFTTTPTFQQEHYSAHLTDTITLLPRVFLELGVRYDIFSPVRTRMTSSTQIFDPSTGLVSNALVNSRYDVNNVAPRIGLAVQPFRRMVFRAGYGMHYFPLPYTLSGLNQAGIGVQSGIAGGFGTTAFRLPVIPTSNTTGVAPNLPYVVASRDRQTPYVQTYSAMIQADLGQGFLMDVGYVGNSGRNLPIISELNASLPGTGLAGLPFLAGFGRTASTTSLTAGSNSNYNSLQVNLTKRFAKSLAFTGAYTFSKALDYGSPLLIPGDLRSSYGLADWDRRHMLSLSHVWRLPFGTGHRYFTGGAVGSIFGDWEFNGILRWATGTPYSVNLDPLLCGCPGITGLRAAPNGFANINGQNSFDTAAFTLDPSQISGIGRNSFRGPEFFTYDAAVYKNFAVMENFKLELRAEAYNVTNNANYSNPVNAAGMAGFGTSTSLLNSLAGRRFQVAARLLF